MPRRWRRSTDWIMDDLLRQLQQAARIVGRTFDQHLNLDGLSNQQFTLLEYLVQHRGVTPKVLAESLSVQACTLTRNLQLLSEAGLVDIACGSDLRSKQLRLSVKGAERCLNARIRYRAAERDLSLRIGSNEIRELQRALDVALKALRGSAERTRSRAKHL